MGEAANSTALISGNRAMSMLDSAFGSDMVLGESGMMATNESRYLDGRRANATASVDLIRPM